MTNLGNIDLLNELNKKDKKDTPEKVNASLKIDDKSNQYESRPQLTPLEYHSSLTNHELHSINNIKKQNRIRGKKTILDETLGEIFDKCINFITYSFDGYSMKFTEAEVIVDVYEDKSWYESIKTHFIAMLLFIRDDDNILYIGILLIFLSIIIYFINITTS
tara:strand:+ start:291 stop:776 length:486 start_codon:yes stop_codon:yes gene_type:complete